MWLLPGVSVDLTGEANAKLWFCFSSSVRSLLLRGLFVLVSHTVSGVRYLTVS